MVGLDAVRAASYGTINYVVMKTRKPPMSIKNSKFVQENKIIGLINCPVSKEFLFKKNHQGITEFLSKKSTDIYETRISHSYLHSHQTGRPAGRNKHR